MKDAHLAAELHKLVGECRQLEKESPALAAAGRIMLFTRLLNTVELLISRSVDNGELAAARSKLHHAVRDFSSLVFAIQNRIENWTVGEVDMRKLGEALQPIMIAARELENLVNERREQ